MIVLFGGQEDAGDEETGQNEEEVNAGPPEIRDEKVEFDGEVMVAAPAKMQEQDEQYGHAA
jgi:hypothetical protein